MTLKDIGGGAYLLGRAGKCPPTFCFQWASHDVSPTTEFFTKFIFTKYGGATRILCDTAMIAEWHATPKPVCVCSFQCTVYILMFVMVTTPAMKLSSYVPPFWKNNNNRVIDNTFIGVSTGEDVGGWAP